jgi:hypothetical protein
MKSSAIPSVCVEPALREQLEQVLREGETLSAFVETSVRENVMRRIDQAAFVQRGLASLESARRTGKTISAAAVVDKLEAQLAAARAAKPRKAQRDAE